MVNSRNGLSWTSALAVVVILISASAALYYLQSGLGKGISGSSTSTSESVSNGTQLETTTTQYTPGPSGSVSTTVYGGCLAFTFNETKALGTVLNSSEVEPYLRGAFSYNWEYASRETCTSWLPPIVSVNVTGFQSVAGNWSTEYLVTYGNSTLLRAEVSSAYQVVNFTATRLPDSTQTLSFTPQQQQAISLALSNPTVKGYLAGIDYYAASVYLPTPSGNQTVSDRYVLYFDQVNGSLVVGVFVNSSITQVVGAYETHACRLFGVNGNIC
jgi:hypothetical protein